MQYPNDTYPRSPITYPQGLLVKEKLLDFTKTIAGKVGPGESYVGNTKIMKKDETTGEELSELFLMYASFGSQQDWFTKKSIHPFTATMELVGNLPNAERHTGRILSAYDATLKASRFFDKYNGDQYRNSELRPLLSMQALFVPLCTVLKTLSPHCEFMVNVVNPPESNNRQENVPEFIATRFPSLEVIILMKDDNREAYDFVTQLYIKTPQEALRNYYVHAYKQSQGKNPDVI